MEQEESKVRVMSPSESNDYDGITIEEGGNSRASDNRRNYYERDFGQGFRIRTFGWKDLLFGQKNMLQRVLMVAGIAAVLSFLFFVALPVIIVLLGVGVAVWLVLQLFLRK